MKLFCRHKHRTEVGSLDNGGKIMHCPECDKYSITFPIYSVKHSSEGEVTIAWRSIHSLEKYLIKHLPKGTTVFYVTEKN